MVEQERNWSGGYAGDAVNRSQLLSTDPFYAGDSLFLLVAHLTGPHGGQGVAGSNPVVPTAERARWLWVKAQFSGLLFVLVSIFRDRPLWSE